MDVRLFRLGSPFCLLVSLSRDLVPASVAACLSHEAPEAGKRVPMPVRTALFACRTCDPRKQGASRQTIANEFLPHPLPVLRSNLLPLLPVSPFRLQTQHSFMLTYRKEGSKYYEIRAETESECNAWMHALDMASFSKMLLQKEELEQKHLHLVQIVESEKTAKWQYTQQCEELTMEIKKLRAEVSPGARSSSHPSTPLPSSSPHASFLWRRERLRPASSIAPLLVAWHLWLPVFSI